MIKRKIYLIIQTAVAVLLFSACQESGIIDNAVLTQNYVEPSYAISASPSSLSFPAYGDTVTVELTVSYNLAWTLSVPSDLGLTVSPTSGKGSTTLTVTAAENPSLQARSGQIRFTARDKSCGLTIEQEGNLLAGAEGNNEADGHAFVDLGLPSGLLWATMNIGAVSLEDSGNLYAWGETETKSNYSWSTYKWCNGSERTLTKYNYNSLHGIVDNKTELELSDDAARANWGGRWRMANYDEWDELISGDYCTKTSVTWKGVTGILYISKANGNRIFMPEWYYWTSTLRTDHPYWAFDIQNGSWHGTSRYMDFRVRPVLQPNETFAISSTTLNFTAACGTESLTIKTHLAWTADTDASWITLSSTSGTGNATVTLTVGENTATDSRSGTITFTADGMVYTVSVTQEGAEDTPGGEFNGHAYVDLGLPSGLLWAACNVGADNPEDYGDYFAWGETTTKTTYDWSTYMWCKGNNRTLTKYNTYSSYGTVDNKTELDLSDDAVRANWGGSWRMATKDEWQELKDNCTWTWTTQGGQTGRKVTSKSNGNSIFLPAAGYRWDSGVDSAGTCGSYWSSSRNAGSPDSAWGVGFSPSYVDDWSSNRDYGQSVRPVCRP